MIPGLQPDIMIPGSWFLVPGGCGDGVSVNHLILVTDTMV
jgi:hypothetical protein